MKLCIDCKWSKKPDGFVVGGVRPLLSCVHAKSGALSPVDGEAAEGNRGACVYQREGAFTDWFGCRFVGICGGEGRWFEPK